MLSVRRDRSRTRRGAVHCDGREAIRAEYAALFDDAESLDCEVLDRLQIGAYVAVAERVTGPAGVTEALAIYHVANGQITDLQLGYLQ